MKLVDLFANLPLEITIDILSRLPIPTIMNSKRVCKSWRDLMKSREFANSHLAKSVPLLVSKEQLCYDQTPCRVIELIIDGKANPCCNKSFSFKFPYFVTIISSVDGLLFLRQLGNVTPLYICNPVTREYIKLPCPPSYPQSSHVFGIFGFGFGFRFELSRIIFGFGLSRITRQYKILCINKDHKLADVHVYTLGTRCWRHILSNDARLSFYTKTGVFFNGNLHWLVSDDLNGTHLRIHYMDLETEVFSTISILSIGYSYDDKGLTVLGDQLCFLGCEFARENIHIWLMKKYGDEKSWTKKFVINSFEAINTFPNIVIRGFKDGDYRLLLAVGYECKVICFSTKTNTARTINLPELEADSSTATFSYTPSFLPQLKSFVKENVSSF